MHLENATMGMGASISQGWVSTSLDIACHAPDEFSPRRRDIIKPACIYIRKCPLCDKKDIYYEDHADPAPSRLCHSCISDQKDFQSPIKRQREEAEGPYASNKPRQL